MEQWLDLIGISCDDRLDLDRSGVIELFEIAHDRQPGRRELARCREVRDRDVTRRGLARSSGEPEAVYAPLIGVSRTMGAVTTRRARRTRCDSPDNGATGFDRGKFALASLGAHRFLSWSCSL
jgi:hypothetical protein